MPDEKSVAVQLDGDSGEPRLESCQGFRWIIAGHQAGVQWRSIRPDRGQVVRHIGGPSPHNAKDSPLRLWVGVDESRKELLVLLTQSVKLRPGSNARPRRMFLIVPAESLSIQSMAPAFESLPLDRVPDSLFERPNDARSAHSNGFLHMAFVLGSKQRSKVAMPIRPYEHQARGTALSLLDSLRSLSDARHFDVYLKFNSYARLGLERVQGKMTCANPPLTTPSFDLRGMYPGGRHGGFDLWQDQGWHDEPTGLDSNKSHKRHVDQGPEKPPSRFQRTDSAPPPAYPGPCHLQHSHLEPSHLESSHIEPSLLQPSHLQIALPAVQVPRSCTPENPATEDQSVTSELSRVHETPRIQSPPSGIPDLSNPSLPSARLYKELAAWLSSVWRTCPYAHYMFILELLNAGAAAKRQDSDAYHKARIACTRRFIEYEADRRPNDDFAQILHSRCLYRAPDVPFPNYAAVICEPSSLISWMLIVNPQADTALFALLIELEKRRKHLLLLRDLVDKGLHDDNVAAEDQLRRSRFIDMKSLIIIEVCFQYGAATLESKTEIIDRMSKELESRLELDQNLTK